MVWLLLLPRVRIRTLAGTIFALFASLNHE